MNFSKKKIAVASGGFDPLHSGHISYLESASLYGDELWVCLNSDEWLKAKKGKAFMPFEERKAVLQAMACVHKVIDFDDKDGSCKKGLLKIADLNPGANIIFCNGGDRIISNIPEADIDSVQLVFGVGGADKKNSSSTILKDWSSNLVERVWGDYSVLFNRRGLKVKELCINPDNGMSFQRHFGRKEIWFVYDGACKVYLQEKNTDIVNSWILKKGDMLEVPKEAWHQITNPFKKICKIIEIQYGSKAHEDDIERKFFYPEIP
jgi:cytidyltransferase-like protein